MQLKPQDVVVLVKLVECGEKRPTYAQIGQDLFLIHGVKYAFPPVRGELTRGMPTA